MQLNIDIIKVELVSRKIRELNSKLHSTLFKLYFRPDLVEWKTVERRQVRERIDTAFHVMEKEYGVTRLLDPEGKIVNYDSAVLHLNKICQQIYPKTSLR